MHETYSDQFGCPCVAIETMVDIDPDEVIEFADEIGARYNDGEDNMIVVDFRVDDRQVGPEVYTERALRSTFKSHTR